MKDLWINKWKPEDIKEIVGNKQAIKQFDEWLKNFDTGKKNSIIISGVHGIGKTLITKLLLEKYNYSYKLIYPDDIKSYRSDNDFVDYYNYNNSIQSTIKFTNKEKAKLSMIFDETESISLQSERKFVFNIYKNNNKHKMFPLIFISNNSHSKLINDLKKYCDEIRFIPPSTYDLIKFVKKISIKEKIKIDDIEDIKKLIEFSQKDIRRLLNILQDFSYNYKILNKENIDNFILASKKKNTDINLYDASLELLNNYHNYDDIYRLYETEKVLLPLMIHENYYKKIYLSTNKLSWDENLEQILNITDSLSIGDNIETSIYTDQNWYLQNIHGYYTCLNTSYWLNKSNKTLKSNDIKFSADLNKTSLKNINKKNLNNLQKIIYKKDIEEILLLNKLCNELYNEGKYEEFINLLKSYKKNIDVKDLELCMKIDKTKDFNILTTKEKKHLMTLF